MLRKLESCRYIWADGVRSSENSAAQNGRHRSEHRSEIEWNEFYFWTTSESSRICALSEMGKKRDIHLTASESGGRESQVQGSSYNVVFLLAMIGGLGSGIRDWGRLHIYSIEVGLGQARDQNSSPTVKRKRLVLDGHSSRYFNKTTLVLWLTGKLELNGGLSGIKQELWEERGNNVTVNDSIRKLEVEIMRMVKDLCTVPVSGWWWKQNVQRWILSTPSAACGLGRIIVLDALILTDLDGASLRSLTIARPFIFHKARTAGGDADVENLRDRKQQFEGRRAQNTPSTRPVQNAGAQYSDSDANIVVTEKADECDQAQARDYSESGKGDHRLKTYSAIKGTASSKRCRDGRATRREAKTGRRNWGGDSGESGSGSGSRNGKKRPEDTSNSGEGTCTKTPRHGHPRGNLSSAGIAACDASAMACYGIAPTASKGGEWWSRRSSGERWVNRVENVVKEGQGRVKLKPIRSSSIKGSRMSTEARPKKKTARNDPEPEQESRKIWSFGSIVEHTLVTICERERCHRKREAWWWWTSKDE
ncbi:hypothetical protein R3P38DRAFT_3358036 [Favolaschia claudopus]|uniref:Uncharacterized protein n=1 Tax=Favolaschia claudopus TaxID=2862362 RepID=A0AAW0B5Q6_9AGAR